MLTLKSNNKASSYRWVNPMEKKTKIIVIFASLILTSFFLGSTTAQPDNSNLLEDVWNAIFGIEEEVAIISDDVLVLETNFNLLERIHELEIRLAVLENCDTNGGSNSESGFPSPDYDSGWHKLTPSASGSEDLVLIHNLDTTEYVVNFIVTDEEPGDLDPFMPSSFHNFGTGGAFIEDYVVAQMIDVGTYWTATKNTFKIHRYPDDVVSFYGRVMLWKLPPPPS